MKNILWKIILIGVFAILGCSACQQATPPPPSPTRTVGGALTPYVFATPSPTPSPIHLPTTTQQPVLPTSTPFTYTIQEGDTLSGIAARYNITVDNIVMANPGLKSNFLVIGEEIIIPAGEENTVTNLPITTPIPVSLLSPHCLPSRDGGMWCFVEASNPLNTALENISAVVNIYTAAGEIAISSVAIPPLNVLHPQEAMPLTAYFPPPLPEDFQASAVLFTALPASEQMASTIIIVQDISYSPGRQQATLTGTIQLAEENSSIQQIWVAGIAYDAEENIVGIRKWVTGVDLSPGQSIPFTLTVFSLGPPIADVKALSEARE